MRCPPLLVAAIASLMFLSSSAGAQPLEQRLEATTKTSSRGRAAPEFPFDINSDDDVRQFRALRSAMKIQTSEVLKKHSQGTLHDDQLARRAAGMLAIINVDFKPRAKLLCELIDTRSSTVFFSEESPITGYPTAEGLAQLRDPDVAEAVLDSLGKPLTRKQLLIRTETLRQMDHAEVIDARIRLAQETSARAANSDSAEQRQLRANLEQVREWLQNPDFFQDRANWPWTMPAGDGDIVVDDRPPPPGKPLDPKSGLPSIKDLDIANVVQVMQFQRLCEAVDYRAWEVLSNQVKGTLGDDKLALRAATLCGEVRVKSSISLLCRNFTLRDKPDDNEAKGPLDGYPAAQALAANRGAEVADAVIESLRAERRLTFEELLLRAHVLRQQDRSQIILVRIDRYKHPAVGGHFGEHLKTIKGWFQTPGFFDDLANWPSRMPK